MATEAPAHLSRPLALHISNLHPDTTEQEIFQHFSQAGPIAHVRILRDAETRLPRGHAYVNYLDQEEAEKALNSLNFSTLHDRVIRVVRALSPSQLNPRANVFLKDLPEGFTSSRLHDVFSTYGPIISTRVPERDGKPLSHGYVQFESEETANEVVKLSAEGGIVVGGEKSTIVAEIFTPRPQRERPFAFTNVYVRNFPISWTVDEFKAFVSQFGNVTSVSIQNTNLTHPETKTASETGFGFANYSTHEEARAAIDGLTGKQAGNFVIEAFQAKTRKEREVEVRALGTALVQQTHVVVYVKGIPVGKIAKEEIEGFFQSLPGYKSFTLETSPQGEYTGVAFVTFVDAGTSRDGVNIIRHQRGWYAAPKRSRAERANVVRYARQPHHMGGMQPQYYPHPYAPHYPPMGNRRHNQRGRHMGPYATGMVQIPRSHRRSHHPPYPHYPPQGYYVQHPPQQHHPHAQVAPVQAPPAAQPQQDPQSRRLALGEALYYRVEKINPERAPKITGMLLEMSEDEVQKLLENETYLHSKVSEAVDVLQKAGQ